MREVIACVLLVAACKPTENERRCAALVDRAVACQRDLPETMQRSMREYCTLTLAEQLRPDDHDSLAYVSQQALREVSAATDCASFGSASAHHQCSFVFQNQDDHDPQFMCFH